VAKYELVIRPSVSKDTKDIPSSDLKKILHKIKALCDDPRPPGSVKLSGMEYYRVRQGDYRIIYEIENERLIVVIVKVIVAKYTDKTSRTSRWSQSGRPLIVDFQLINSPI
jgi:mRNA interferase RelE/StbE